MKPAVWLSCFILVIAAKVVTGQPLPKPQVNRQPALYDTIARLDSVLFEAYNNCRLQVFENLISDDIEFYHDRGGLTTSKSELMTGLKNNICGKVTRVLMEGSIEVHNIPAFGAVQFGMHRFINASEPDAVSLFSKFVHTWKREAGGWKLYRVISLHN